MYERILGAWKSGQHGDCSSFHWVPHTRKAGELAVEPVSHMRFLPNEPDLFLSSKSVYYLCSIVLVSFLFLVELLLMPSQVPGNSLYVYG